jgi:predicted nucleic acid-binding protein
LLIALTAHAQVNSGSNDSDDALNPTTSIVINIAGQAVASGLTLVTNNAGEFKRVSGLKLESWP